MTTLRWNSGADGYEPQSGQHVHTWTAFMIHHFVFTFQFSRLLDQLANYIMIIYQLNLIYARFTMSKPLSMAALG